MPQSLHWASTRRGHSRTLHEMWHNKNISIMKVSKPRVSLQGRSFPRACCATAVAVPVCRHGRSESSIVGDETKLTQKSICSAPAAAHNSTSAQSKYHSDDIATMVFVWPAVKDSSKCTYYSSSNSVIRFIQISRYIIYITKIQHIHLGRLRS